MLSSTATRRPSPAGSSPPTFELRRGTTMISSFRRRPALSLDPRERVIAAIAECASRRTSTLTSGESCSSTRLRPPPTWSVVMVGLRARSAAASLSPWALQDDNRHRRLPGQRPKRGRSHGGRHEFRKKPRDHLNERVNLFPSCGRELLVARSERQLEDVSATQLYSPTRPGRPQGAFKERHQVAFEGAVICEFTRVGPADEVGKPRAICSRHSVPACWIPTS